MVARHISYSQPSITPAMLPVSSDAVEMTNDSLRFVLRESGEPNWDCLSRHEMLDALASRSRRAVSY